MRPLRDFKAQALLGYAAVSAITVAALVIALLLDRRAGEARERLLAGYYDNELIAARVEFNAEKMVAASRGYLLTGDLRTLESVRAAEADLDSAIWQLERSRSLAPVAEHLASIEWSVAEYRSAFHRLVEEAHEAPSRAAMAQAVEAQLLPRRAELGRHLQDLVNDMDRQLAEGRAAAEASATRQLRLLLSIGGVSVLLSWLLAWTTARRLHALYVMESYSKRRAERASQAREELLGVVAHDLRTPLSAILIGATSIRRRTEDTKARKAAEGIERIAGRMESLIRSLLDAASIEAGRFSVARESCAVSQVLTGTVDMFGSLAAEKSIQLRQQVDGQDLVVLGDRERLIQVLSNLLSNALKFTPRGGEIGLRVREANRCVRFEVRDTGPGIAPEHVPRLFERYWRGEVGGRMGAGLGLYIAKSIVDAHGGRILGGDGTGRRECFSL